MVYIYRRGLNQQSPIGGVMAIATRTKPHYRDELAIELLLSILEFSLGFQIWYVVVAVVGWSEGDRPESKYECESDVDPH